MKVLSRCRRILGYAIRILISTIAANFSKISDDEQVGVAENTSHSQNMNSKNSFGQCHINNSQRSRNMSGSQNIDVYYKFFTVARFKVLAVLIVLVSACYHVALHLRNGHNTCQWLLTDGRFQGYNEWQPHGCMMHKYSKSDSRNCMNYVSYWGGRNHFVFVGDSRMRQLYLEFVGLLSKESFKSSKHHVKLSFSDAKTNVLVEFFWAPLVDNSMREILDFWAYSDSSPRLVVIGSALWTIKLNNGSEDVIPSFKNNVTSMKSIFSKYKDSSEVVWMLQDHVVEAKLFANKSMITNRQVDLYNRATIESLISSRVQIWSSSVLIGQGFLGRDYVSKKDQKPTKDDSMVTTAKSTVKKYEVTSALEGQEFDEEENPGDGLNLPQEALGWDVQVLLNMICNNYMNFDDGSCCTAPENPTPLQMVLAVFFATSFVVAFTVMLCKHLASLSRKVSLIKRNNRTISNGFGHFVASHKNFNGKDHENKDGKEHALCHTIHDMTSQMKRFPESCNFFMDSITSFDSQHKCVDNSCDTQRSSTTCKKNSVDFQCKSKEFMGGTFHLTNFQDKKCQDHRCLEDITIKDECNSQDSPLQLASSASPIQNGYSRPMCEESQAIDCYSIVCCISKLGIILSYFFVCDRTTFFMKENKYYTHVNFFLPFTYLMVLGLFFTEKTSQMEVLNRSQTDEWKGWMQIVILIYHLTGASKVLSIYMQIRVMASAYLFLSAYGHFSYFYNKDDFSLHRLCTVIFRFNFLVALLCLAMNRPYQFYNFIPLVTFWFVVIFIVMAIPSRLSSSNSDNRLVACWWLMMKIIVLILFATLLYSSEVLFDKIFLSYFLKPLFVSSDESIRDWRFRWSVDRYSSIYGLVFSLLLILLKKIVDDSKGGNLSSSRLITLASIAISSCGLLCYAVFTSLCQSKDQCNERHSYIAFIPILCYIILRNTLGCVRKKFSAFFAWFGKISLELFIAQYHIWLAADTHGILVLIPSYPVLNIIMTSFVFVCVAHELKQITNFLTPLFVPPSKFPLLRNILLVLVFTTIRHFLPF